MNEFSLAPDIAPAPRDRRQVDPEPLVLDLDGYEGPIDLLLSLARAQKLDLTAISVLALADQYLDFIAEKRRLGLDIADDYLVMVAVLIYLKSCLLLPPAAEDDEPVPEDRTGAERDRLALLAAIQSAGRRLMACPRLDRDFFVRGAPEASTLVVVPRWEVGFTALLQAYGEGLRRRAARILAIEPSAFHSMEEALERLAASLGRMANWREMSGYLPAVPGDGELRRSAVAATFAAVLELARSGRIELRQDRVFGPIWLRRAASTAGRGESEAGGR
jgi:segregation and condensation protein A